MNRPKTLKMPLLSGIGIRNETTRCFTKTVASLVLNLVFKTVFGVFLTRLVFPKSVKYEMSGNFQVRSQEIL
jgi:hypothetical protein